jgi:hypothetical protein
MTLTKDQLQYLQFPEVVKHMDLVIDSNQQFGSLQSDISVKLKSIAAAVLDHPIDNCSGCLRNAYMELRERLAIEIKPAKGKSNASK